jgi:hypothetical protein
LGYLDNSKKEKEYLQKIEKLRSKCKIDIAEKKNGNFEMFKETRFVINSEGARYLKKSAKTKEEEMDEIKKVCNSNFK